jgi:hypothetical protein
MATYQEIADLCGDSALQARISAAIAAQALTITTELNSVANNANRLLWAKEAFADPRGMAGKMIMAVLISNVAATKAQIQAASDAQLLTAVQAVVNVFANGKD